MARRGKRGRPEIHDDPLLARMARIELREEITAATELARRVADRAEGASEAAKVKRLAEKYREQRQELLRQARGDTTYLQGMSAEERALFGRFLTSLGSDEERAEAIAQHLAYYRRQWKLPLDAMNALRRRGVSGDDDDLLFARRVVEEFLLEEYGDLYRKLHQFEEKEAEKEES